MASENATKAICTRTGLFEPGRSKTKLCILQKNIKTKDLAMSFNGRFDRKSRRPDQD